MLNWILQFFEQSIASIVFFSIFAAGMVFTLGSLIFGGDADHGDGDMSGDQGDAGSDHDVSHDTGDDDQSLGLLSIRGISLMATGFGGVSFLVYVMTKKVLLSSVSGVMSGWLFALLLLIMLRAFKKQQASSIITPDEVMGSEGVVTVSIPPHEIGEVRLSVSGSELIRMASALGNKALATGTPVKVVRYLGGSVVVTPITGAES